MRILHFDILNTKAVKSFILDPNGEHVQIAGKAGTGKTTAASCLWELMNRSKDCLTHGERKGHIIIHLGEGEVELIARRDFTAKTNTITVERADGGKVSSADFKSMLSVLAENPHKIAEMKPLQRTQTLLAAADLGETSLEEMDTQIAEAEKVRLNAGRRAEDSIPGPEPDKAVAVDVSAISAKISAARDHNEEVANDQRNVDEIIRTGKLVVGYISADKEDVANLTEEVANLEDKLDVARVQLANHERERTEATTLYKDRKKAHDLMVVKDTTELQAQLDSATEVNAVATKHDSWKDRNEQHTKLEDARACADEAVKDLRDGRAELLENAKWPIPGLSIEDGDITFEGALFDNLGQSDQMYVCAALAMKDILAHPLHCCRLDGVESMGSERLVDLQKLFGDNGVQVISTRVSRNDEEPGEIVISEMESGDNTEGALK